MASLSKPKRILLALVALASALAGIADHEAWPSLPRFLIATLALGGLAWLVAFCAEQVGDHLGPALTGTLQATLGNLPELFVVIFALQRGETVIAQTAIVGSILANALLVLGLVIVVGAARSRDGVMRFGSRLPNDTATLLLVTAFIIALLGLSLGAHDRASHHVQAISIVGACCLLVVYFAWAVPYVRSGTAQGGHQAANAPDEIATVDPTATARISMRLSLALLVTAGGASAFVSDWFVNALTPAIHTLHLSQAFAGLVIVAIAGNAVEHAGGIVLAWRGRSELAISIVKGSVAQIAAFVFPLLVLISLLLSSALTFALAPVYVGALTLTALVVWQVTGDGEAVAFEGWALVAIYVVVAVIAAFE